MPSKFRMKMEKRLKNAHKFYGQRILIEVKRFEVFGLCVTIKNTMLMKTEICIMNSMSYMNKGPDIWNDSRWNFETDFVQLNDPLAEKRFEQKESKWLSVAK